MFGLDLYILFILGVLISLIFVEKIGIVLVGLVVLGYLGFVFNQLVFILFVLLVSFFIYVIVKYGLFRFMILYGCRKFAVMLIMGICLKIVFDFFYLIVLFEILEFCGIGIIVLGLIVNIIQKQGLMIIFVSMLFLSGVIFVIMFVYYLI